MLNVLAVPGDVFEELKTSGTCRTNWLVPAVLYGLIAALASFLILSQPAVVEKMRERQAKAYDRMVEQGKITQEKADQMVDAFVKVTTSTPGKIFWGVVSLAAGFVIVFWWAFLLWLIGRFGLKVRLSFMKLAEVAGLASVISTLASVVKLLLVISLSDPLASPSLAMLVRNQDPHNKLFMILGWVDVMALWGLVVRAIGLSKLSGARFTQSAIWVFGAWLGIVMFFLGIAAVLQGLFAG